MMNPEQSADTDARCVVCDHTYRWHYERSDKRFHCLFGHGDLGECECQDFVPPQHNDGSPGAGTMEP